MSIPKQLEYRVKTLLNCMWPAMPNRKEAEMKVTIGKKEFLKGISKVLGITGRKTNIQITSTVLIRALEDKVSLLATDLETGFEGKYSADVIEEGEIAVNARKLFEIIKDFPSDEIFIYEVENRWITIEADKSKTKAEFHIVGMDPEEFPEFPKFDHVDSFEINSGILKEMIEKCLITGVSEDNRLHLAGLLLERFEEDENKIIRMVCTDGHRLIKIDRLFSQENNFQTGDPVIIPKKGMSEIVKLLDSDEITQIGFHDNNLIVKHREEMIFIRLLEGDYPDYREVIPQVGDFFMKVPKSTFLGLLKRMSILSSDRYNGVVFNLNQERLETSATNPEIGDSKEDISVEYNGEALEMAFNPRYFIESLNVIKSDSVIIKILDFEHPFILEGEDDPFFMTVIMPMKI